MRSTAQQARFDRGGSFLLLPLETEVKMKKHMTARMLEAELVDCESANGIGTC
jgi:hypothetical protein